MTPSAAAPSAAPKNAPRTASRKGADGFIDEGNGTEQPGDGATQREGRQLGRTSELLFSKYGKSARFSSDFAVHRR